MNHEPPDPLGSLFDRLIARSRPWWFTAGLWVLLLALPLAGAFVDGILRDAWERGYWRGLVLPPAIIAYVFAVAPPMARMAAATRSRLRNVALLDDAAFESLAGRGAGMSVQGEIGAAAAGALAGLWMSARGISGTWNFSVVLSMVFTAGMYALLAWVIFRSMEGSGLVRRLVRQPMRVDPLDVTPFEPLARQSLLLSLVFVGGITLSLALTNFSPGILTMVEFWLAYLPLAAVPVLVFFLNLYPIHRVLAAARDRELAAVERRLHDACRQLMRLTEEGAGPGAVPAEIAAWAAYRNELLAARTWPYDTSLLRTLFFSVLVPGGTLLGRVIVDVVS